MFYKKIYRSVLIDRFTEQTRQFIKVLLRGERYPGEYKNCKDSLESIQKQLLWEEKRSDYNISVSAPGKLSININKGQIQNQIFLHVGVDANDYEQFQIASTCKQHFYHINSLIAGLAMTKGPKLRRLCSLCAASPLRGDENSEEKYLVR